MKLVHKNINKQFNFKESNFCHLIIENSKEFYNLTNELYRQCVLQEEGNWVLSNIEQLDICKNTLFIYDYYQINLNSKKTQNIINNEVLKILKESDYFELLSKINLNLITLNENVLENINLPIQFNSEFCFEDFIKFSNYTVKEETGFLQKILCYIDLFLKLKNIKLVIFVNLLSVVSQQELVELLKQLSYMQLPVFFISSKTNLNCNNLENKNASSFRCDKTNIFSQNFINSDNKREDLSNKNEDKNNIFFKNNSNNVNLNKLENVYIQKSQSTNKICQNINKNLEENVARVNTINTNDESSLEIETTIIDKDLCVI